MIYQVGLLINKNTSNNAPTPRIDPQRGRAEANAALRSPEPGSAWEADSQVLLAHALYFEHSLSPRMVPSAAPRARPLSKVKEEIRGIAGYILHKGRALVSDHKHPEH